jgi:hypothetical protein
VRGVGGHSTRGKIAPGEFSAEEAAKLQLKNFKTEERLRKLYDGSRLRAIHMKIHV